MSHLGLGLSINQRRGGAPFPASRFDLVLWPKVRLGAVYSDTGGTTPTALNGNVAAIRDGKTGGLWTLTSGQTAAVLRQDAAGAYYLDCAGATSYDAPAFSLASQSFTYYSRQLTTNKSHQGALIAFGSNSLNWYLGTGLMQVFPGGSFGAAARLREFADNMALVSDASNLTTVTADASAARTAITSATYTTAKILGVGSSLWQGRFYEGVLVGAADGSTARATMFAYLGTRPTYSAAKRVVCVGDSRTWGYGPSATANDYPNRLATQLGVTWDVINLGIVGVTTSGMVNPDSFYSAGLTKKVCVAWSGVNSDWGDYAAFRSFVQARIATGWSVIVCTDLYGAGRTSANRTTYNASIAANTGDGYTIADLAGTSGVGADADVNGANFNADHLHPNDAGDAIIEPVIRSAVLAV